VTTTAAQDRNQMAAWQAHGAAVSRTLSNFTGWLARYGEMSWDHQSFFAGPIGGRAKALYYRNRLAGAAAVAPMIFCEAFVPSTRRLFHRRIRFAIADAHYAMGFAYLFEADGRQGHLDCAVSHLDALLRARCRGFAGYCWGYPFDWVTRNGTIAAETPLITTTPYVYEAFQHVHRIQPCDQWTTILESIARHAALDIKDFRTSEHASSCSYTPFDRQPVINAAAYRGYLLIRAAYDLGRPEFRAIGERNLNFVLESQNHDGSWFYAADGERNFVDHFHTCFVMKALAKIHDLTGDRRCLAALARGLDYYLSHLFDEQGFPRPFARAPRVTLYRCELYDCAECINLCLLLRQRFPRLEAVLEHVVGGIVRDWVKRDGSFRSRRLLLGWDNVPMHRWAQSQMFRSLAFLQAQAASGTVGRQAVVSARS